MKRGGRRRRRARLCVRTKINDEKSRRRKEAARHSLTISVSLIKCGWRNFLLAPAEGYAEEEESLSIEEVPRLLAAPFLSVCSFFEESPLAQEKWSNGKYETARSGRERARVCACASERVSACPRPRASESERRTEERRVGEEALATNSSFHWSIGANVMCERGVSPSRCLAPALCVIIYLFYQ